MWFKNLIVYRITAGWTLSSAALEDHLGRRTLQRCGSLDMESRGWIATGPSERLVHTVNRQHLIALGLEQKLLPASIIKQVAAEKAAEIAQEQGYPVGRKQMREIKDRVSVDLRARALTRRSVTRAWINPELGWIAVDAAGTARAEILIETLRDTLGSLNVQLLTTHRAPQSSMGAWLMMGDAPLRFAIDQDLELQALDNSKAVVRYVRHPLATKDIQAHLAAGKTPTRLGLTWNDRVAFVLNDKLHLKRLQFLEFSTEQAAANDNPDEQFDIDFAVMSGELSQLLTELTEALGGEPQQQAAA